MSTHLGNHHCNNQGTLIDLAELDTPSSSSPVLAPAPPTSGIPILPPPPQTSGPPRSHSASQAEAPPGHDSTSNALSLLDEELLCLGTCKHGVRGRKVCTPGLRGLVCFISQAHCLGPPGPTSCRLQGNHGELWCGPALLFLEGLESCTEGWKWISVPHLAAGEHFFLK